MTRLSYARARAEAAPDGLTSPAEELRREALRETLLGGDHSALRMPEKRAGAQVVSEQGHTLDNGDHPQAA